jgi:hypothetical protein
MSCTFDARTGGLQPLRLRTIRPRILPGTNITYPFEPKFKKQRNNTVQQQGENIKNIYYELNSLKAELQTLKFAMAVLPSPPSPPPPPPPPPTLAELDACDLFLDFSCFDDLM